MTLKIAPASAEEYTFAQAVNRKLAGTGASVHAFTQVDSADKEPRGYGLVMQCGGRRETLKADSPFHYDSEDDVVMRVKRWIASAGAGDRWTTDLEKADGN